MKKLSVKNGIFFALLLLVGTFVSCLSDGDETIVLESKDILGIPSDSKATPNPTINEETTYIPNVQYTIDQEEGAVIMRIDMTGIQDPQTLKWIKLFGTEKEGQNVWVSVDGKPKGIEVYNNSDDDANKTITADLVFLVDNSGSMSEEADAIARDIVAWARTLASSGLDIRFGCVGYGGNVGSQYSYLVENYGITGALNITTFEQLNNFLNNRSQSGTARTKGFVGDDKTTLQSIAGYSYYSDAGGECGVQALRFANENFSFRNGANRIYVNFTDDANYPGGFDEISIKYLLSDWKTSMGTIHTVFSNDSSSINSRLSIGEKPWLMSRYTGGTELYASSSFTGVSLNDLPVTGAMQNAYIIRFTNIDEFMDGKPHNMKITVLSKDRNVQAEKTFSIVFGEKNT